MGLKSSILAIAGLLIANSAFAADVEFMFSGDGVKALGQQTAHVEVGETLKISELTERFSGYETTLSNECEGFCIIIKKGANSISVFYDQDEKTISHIEGWCSAGGGIVDQSGAQCGDEIAAVSNMKCESGESQTCASKELVGLSYIVGEGSKVEGFTVENKPAAQVTASETKTKPRAGDFLTSDIYRDKPRLPDFKGRDREFNTYRTRIRDGMREGPNYAGRYSVIQIGCGTGCSFVVIGDNKTGRPMNFPRGGDDNMYLQLQYQLDSRLVTAQWADADGGKCYIEFFDFNGDEWIALDKFEVGATEACFSEIAKNVR